MFQVASAFLQLPNGKLVLQLRSNISGISSPGRIAAFGGKVEDGENIKQALIRELIEETGVDVTEFRYTYLGFIEMYSEFKKEDKQEHNYLVQIPSIDIINVAEGVGFAVIDPQTNVDEIYLAKGTSIAWPLMQREVFKQK